MRSWTLKRCWPSRVLFGERFGSSARHNNALSCKATSDLMQPTNEVEPTEQVFAIIVDNAYHARYSLGVQTASTEENEKASVTASLTQLFEECTQLYYSIPQFNHTGRSVPTSIKWSRLRFKWCASVAHSGYLFARSYFTLQQRYLRRSTQTNTTKLAGWAYLTKSMKFDFLSWHRAQICLIELSLSSVLSGWSFLKFERTHKKISD